jgi:hypothetical protein
MKSARFAFLSKSNIFLACRSQTKNIIFTKFTYRLLTVSHA